MRKALRCIWKGQPVIFGGRAFRVEHSKELMGVGMGQKLTTTRWKALQSWVRYFFWKHDWIRDGVNHGR